ncbi:GtrA family protein, partial [Nostoc sp. UCD120]|uniref:GtrA family protein n=2 Tax=unclassified Nostoc TaxID=2593658 RepID=UPI001623B9D3
MKQHLEYFNIIFLIDKVYFYLHSALFSRFIRFAVVGFSGVFVDLGAFYFLHSSLFLSLTLSAMLSTEIAIINNFIWNDL